MNDGEPMFSADSFQRAAVSIYLPSDEQKYFDFPLIVNKVWETSFRKPGAKKWSRTEAKVVSIENITTNALSCESFKIERKENRGNNFKIFTYWYCPKTGSNIVYESEYEAGNGSKIKVRAVLIRHTR